MARPFGKIAPDWWDYTTIDPEILADAAKLTEETLFNLSRPGFKSIITKRWKSST